MLNALQRLLEQIYRVEIPHRVEDFLITDADLARRLDTSENPQETQEKLLVQQDEDEVSVALYVDGEVMQRLASDDPLTALHDGNLADFLLALEGVSHFLYLIYHAHSQRGVSLLELEMQGEVDKYITTTSLIGRQRDGRVPSSLRHRLFESVSFLKTLNQTQLERYREANHYAGKYCWKLERQYLRAQRGTELLHELRHFYRLSQHGKIQHINAAPG